ncbi:MAG: hypothetical protein Q7V56_07800 [Gammaproteobacteria bacterium]|nr:hypothetical protein [Gammaproteobacteria bacterium]
MFEPIWQGAQLEIAKQITKLLIDRKVGELITLSVVAWAIIAAFLHLDTPKERP